MIWFQRKGSRKVPIFHHIPKCGGTALRSVLEKWFEIKKDYISLKQLRGEVPVNPPLDLYSLGFKQCLSSHFESKYNYLGVRYPEVFEDKDRFFVFTVVRDPLEIKKSLYYYEIKSGRRNANDQSLADFLLSSRNYLANRFPCDENNYRDVLDRYDFIGVQEYMDSTVGELARLLGKKKIKVPKVNIAKRDGQETEINAELIEDFRSKNALDYKVYAYALQKFNVQ